MFSLVMAMMIWFAVQSSVQSGLRAPQNPFRQLETHEFRKTVSVIAPATNQMTFLIEPHEVRVSISAEKSLFRKFSSDDIQVYVDLTDLTFTHGEFPLKVLASKPISQWVVSPDRVMVKAENKL